MMNEKHELNFRFDLNEKNKKFHLIGKIFLSVIIISITYSLFMSFLLFQYAKKLSHDSLTYYFEKSPDIIAVFTGDRGRLEYAINLIDQYPEAKLLITGVYNKNTIKTLLNTKNMKILKTINEAKASQLVELDYQAKNTVENVLMTLHYIKKDPSYKHLLIISSDYHLLRIQLLANTLNKGTTLESIHYYGINSNHHLLKRISDSTYEGFKIIKSLFFSIFWISDENELINQ